MGVSGLSDRLFFCKFSLFKYSSALCTVTMARNSSFRPSRLSKAHRIWRRHGARKRSWWCPAVASCPARIWSGHRSFPQPPSLRQNRWASNLRRRQRDCHPASSRGRHRQQPHRSYPGSPRSCPEEGGKHWDLEPEGGCFESRWPTYYPGHFVAWTPVEFNCNGVIKRLN